MFFEQPSIETTLLIEYSGVCARPYGRTCRRFVNAHFIAAKRQNDVSGLRAKPTHMSRVFMCFAACGETLFEARCGAKDFLDKLREPGTGSLRKGLFAAIFDERCTDGARAGDQLGKHLGDTVREADLIQVCAKDGLG